MSTLHRRKQTGAKASTGSPLPVDYTNMVKEILTANYSDSFGAKGKSLSFHVSGTVFLDEILISTTLYSSEKKNAGIALSVHASSEFDPQANAPTAEDLLAACVDACGGVWDKVLGQPGSAINQLNAPIAELGKTDSTLPLGWSPTQIDRFQIFVLIDKANPLLDQMADDWLAKHDPDYASFERESQEEAESLFIVPKVDGKKPR